MVQHAVAFDAEAVNAVNSDGLSSLEALITAADEQLERIVPSEAMRPVRDLEQLVRDAAMQLGDPDVLAALGLETVVKSAAEEQPMQMLLVPLDGRRPTANLLHTGFSQALHDEVNADRLYMCNALRELDYEVSVDASGILKASRIASSPDIASNRVHSSPGNQLDESAGQQMPAHHGSLHMEMTPREAADMSPAGVGSFHVAAGDCTVDATSKLDAAYGSHSAIGSSSKSPEMGCDIQSPPLLPGCFQAQSINGSSAASRNAHVEPVATGGPNLDADGSTGVRALSPSETPAVGSAAKAELPLGVFSKISFVYDESSYHCSVRLDFTSQPPLLSQAPSQPLRLPPTEPTQVLSFRPSVPKPVSRTPTNASGVMIKVDVTVGENDVCAVRLRCVDSYDDSSLGVITKVDVTVGESGLCVVRLRCVDADAVSLSARASVRPFAQLPTQGLSTPHMLPSVLAGGGPMISTRSTHWWENWPSCCGHRQRGKLQALASPAAEHSRIYNIGFAGQPVTGGTFGTPLLEALTRYYRHLQQQVRRRAQPDTLLHSGRFPEYSNPRSRKSEAS